MLRKKRIYILIYAIFCVIMAIILMVSMLICFAWYPLKYKGYIVSYSSRYNLDSALVSAVILQESGFRPDAISSAGAMGLMQLLPATAMDIADKLGEDFVPNMLFDEETNIRYGCYYLNYLFVKFGVLRTVLAAYNAGPGNVNRWLSMTEYSKDGTTLDYIPFAETRDYVVNVVKNISLYRRYWHL